MDFGMASQANPYSAAISAGAGLGKSAIESALGGNNPSGAGAFDMRSYMDGSGWTVSTGRASATSSSNGSKKYEAGMTQDQAAEGAARSASTGLGASLAGIGTLGLDSSTMWLAAGVVVVLLVLKRRGAL